MILLANNEPANDENGASITVALNNEDGATQTVDGLPKYDKNGNIISYSWIEDTDALPKGCSIKSIETSKNETTITNTYVTGSLVIEKSFFGTPEDADVSGWRRC